MAKHRGHGLKPCLGFLKIGDGACWWSVAVGLGRCGRLGRERASWACLLILIFTAAALIETRFPASTVSSPKTTVSKGKGINSTKTAPAGVLASTSTGVLAPAYALAELQYILPDAMGSIWGRGAGILRIEFEAAAEGTLVMRRRLTLSSSSKGRSEAEVPCWRTSPSCARSLRSWRVARPPRFLTSRYPSPARLPFLSSRTTPRESALYCGFPPGLPPGSRSSRRRN